MQQPALRPAAPRPVLALPVAALVLGALLVSACGGGDRYEATIRRTSFGIPHIQAADLGSLGFGEGYAQAEDHLCTVSDQVVRARGERAKYFGRGENDEHLRSDLGMRALRVHQRAGDDHAAQPPELREWLEGYVAGYNQWLEETGRENVPGWCRGQDWVFPITATDLAAYHRVITLIATNFVDAIAGAQPPEVAAGGAPEATAGGPAAPLPDPAALGESNGWALGRDLAESGRGMLIANPHYPWVGSNRFWEKHLTIPGELDVYGAGLIGIPGVAIGFNRAVAWTHTVSAGERFTLYSLDLAPGDPTRYRYGDEERAMTAVDVSVEVAGEAEPVSRQVWFSHYGPIVTLRGLDWTAERAYAIRDVNELNDEGRLQWMAMNRAGSMAELQQAHAEHQGMPWVNTISTSAEGVAWYTDSASTPNLSDEAISLWLERRESDPLARQLWEGSGIVALDGSDPRFEWQDDPAARDPGLVAFADMPQIERTDYLFNANDSFWFANSGALLEGDYSPLHGEQGTQRSLRTRHNDLHLSNATPDQPAGENAKFSLEELQRAILSNRSLTADLLLPELVARCQATPRVTLNGRRVDLAEACAVLEGWNRRFDLDSEGAVLFREWIGQYEGRDLVGKGRLFAVDYDPADPVHTPRGLAAGSLALEHLAKAVEILLDRDLPLDVALGELQYAPSKLPQRIPVHGGNGAYEGLLNLQQGGINTTTLEPLELAPRVEGSRFLTEAGYPAVHGSSFLMALEYTDDGPRAEAFLTFSQSGDPSSEHFTDQTELFARKEWRPILFEQEAIAADTRREYTVTGLR
ncbi:MAG TPA: penicillin acylase family protein [Thermoanaerobaculia bacterium]|nr:penicillin acylase family protein [Thermoanaerobaculia bacterium]